MSTDELERLERRLEAALHEAGDQPVDVPAGRAVLGQRVGRQQQLVRRWTVVGVAASVLAVVVTTSLVMAGLRDDHEGLPVAPPHVTLSPSGLPVGVLEGRVDRTEEDAVSRLRIVVRADGTGTWNSGTTGDSAGPSVADYAVTFVGDGPGRVVIRSTELACFTRNQLTLTFSVRGTAVHVEQVLSNDCLLSPGLSNDLAGTTLRIRPLPLELSPSGLPVGTLEGLVPRTSGEHRRHHLPPAGASGRHRDHPARAAARPDRGRQHWLRGRYPSGWVPVGSRSATRGGRSVPARPGPRRSRFTVRGRTLSIDAAQSPGCLVERGADRRPARDHPADQPLARRPRLPAAVG